MNEPPDQRKGCFNFKAADLLKLKKAIVSRTPDTCGITWYRTSFAQHPEAFSGIAALPV